MTRSSRRRAKKQRKIALATAPLPSREADLSKGTITYAYNHYRKSILTELLNDLITLENEGLNENFCRLVRQSLGCFVNATTEIPEGGFFTGAIYTEVQSFEETYAQWNDVQGTGSEAVATRRKLLIKLRKKRQSITNKIRSVQYELANNLDVQIMESTYRAIDELIKLAPSIFKNLAQSYSYFVSKGGYNFV
jgi:hypothetical protein